MLWKGQIHPVLWFVWLKQKKKKEKSVNDTQFNTICDTDQILRPDYALDVIWNVSLFQYLLLWLTVAKMLQILIFDSDKIHLNNIVQFRLLICQKKESKYILFL